jgi:hypothetical protein
VTPVTPSESLLVYNFHMARGWDSKSVEEQISSKISSKEFVATKIRKGPSAEEWERTRQQKVLNLSRERILDELERTQNPRYAELLKKSLAEIDDQLGAL